MKFSLIGTGNAAWHFAGMLRDHGHTLFQIYARNPSNAVEFNAEIISSPDQFTAENDLIIVAVKDDAIAGISRQIPLDIATIHVSGATSIDALVQKNKGVVWPVQTIRKNEKTDHSETPFLIEASNDTLQQMLMTLFGEISNTVFHATGEQRAKAHMATVFANNFTTQLLGIAEEILREEHLPLTVSLPSVKEIFRKLETRRPADIQTGPARRADMETLHKQLALLKGKPELKEIYTLFSNRILRSYYGHEL